MTVGSRIVDLLQDQGLIGLADAERALAHQRREGLPLVLSAMQEGGADERVVQRAVENALSLESISEERLLHLRLSPELLEQFPRVLALETLAVAIDFDRERRRLTIAMVDPTDVAARDRLMLAVGAVETRCFVVRYSVLLRAIDAIYEARIPGGSGRASSAGEMGQRASRLAGGRKMDSGWEQARTTVELIRGKVAVDPSLAREMGVVGARTAADGIDSTDSVVTNNIGVQVLPGETLIEDEDEDEPSELVSAAGVSAGDGMDPPTAPWSRSGTLVTDSARWDRAADEGDSALTQIRELALPVAEADAKQREALLWELLASTGVLVSMLEERMDPEHARGRQMARLARLVARELSFDDLTVSRIALAAQLYGLEVALRAEIGDPPPEDVVDVFSARSRLPGGLNPTLRALGARSLALDEANPPAPPRPAAVVQAVSDCLMLLAQSAEVDAVLRGLRERGIDDVILAAVEYTLQRVVRGGST